MEFKIPEPTQRIIDAHRAIATIVESVDMDDYEDVHGGDDDLIDAIYALCSELGRQADQIEQEQGAMVATLQAHYDKKYGGESCGE